MELSITSPIALFRSNPASRHDSSALSTRMIWADGDASARSSSVPDAGEDAERVAAGAALGSAMADASFASMGAAAKVNGPVVAGVGSTGSDRHDPGSPAMAVLLVMRQSAGAGI